MFLNFFFNFMRKDKKTKSKIFSMETVLAWTENQFF